MHDNNSPQHEYERSYAMYCDIEDISPVDSADTSEFEFEGVKALFTAQGLSEFISKKSGVIIELIPGDSQANAQRVVNVINALNTAALRLSEMTGVNCFNEFHFNISDTHLEINPNPNENS